MKRRILLINGKSDNANKKTFTPEITSENKL